MTMATITPADGTVTLEHWLTEVDSVLTPDERHEITLWNDGSISIDSLLIEGIDSEHTSLDLAAVRTLRDFLAIQKVSEMLAAS